MKDVIRYHVTFASQKLAERRLLGVNVTEYKLCDVAAIDAGERFIAYHLHKGDKLEPNYKLIRESLPHYHVAAFDRAFNGSFWFPATLRSQLSGIPDQKNAASLTILNVRGKLIGTIYATPYLKDRAT